MSTTQLAGQAVDVTGGWTPHIWLGAPAPGGLALPAAHPTMAWLYSPRGVFLDEECLVVADSGNHRVLIWHGVPEQDEQPADVVLGQPDGTTEGPAAGGRGPERGMHLPTGVLVHDGRLIVADAWHHRILVWDEVPRRSDQPPDLVLGQPDVSSAEPNRGAQCSACSMYWPYGVGIIDGWFYVADTGNRRVLGWADGIPDSPDVPADLVLGQPDPSSREENRGEQVGPASFRWPHDVTGTAGLLLVADAGNHRVVGWRPLPEADRDADLLLGQPDFQTASEFPYGPQRGDRFRFPYAASLDGSRLAVADTANNRVLLWDDLPTDGRPADAVLGQPSFEANGENRWSSVERDTLCWPYGLCLHGDRLAIADSGNNRVLIWRRA
ncbi:NHL repeat containing protein [Carbonactinospora thermoautotrophica]|uniref:NHL repeat containing protein n=1 Tax=Carbonactinospora thermoautotrophica TaxID=1469144 RepID=A0A132MV13_9ACTN|nr:NHL repeat-containing protein [Carbonactinospora thermoautotrophica]KWX01212.1 NHL repeat containing protein [Carbonactinospora thermoautotrophica]